MVAHSGTWNGWGRGGDGRQETSLLATILFMTYFFTEGWDDSTCHLNVLGNKIKSKKYLSLNKIFTDVLGPAFFGTFDK